MSEPKETMWYEKLALEAEKKLTPEELDALRGKHLNEFTTWCVEDMDKIPLEWQHKRSVIPVYYRIIWLGDHEPRSAHIDEIEAGIIRMLRDKCNLSMDEIAFVTDRSTSTIHHHLLQPRPDKPQTPIV